MKVPEIDPDIVPNLKLGLHSFQVIFSFVAWCLAIGVFTAKESSITGLNGWTFAVCMLSIPAWIFLVMTPRFERTRRFAQPHAMLAVDALFAVIWLSALSTQASFNSKGDCGNACGISKGVVGLGVFVFLLFCGTTFVSLYTLNYYNFHGNLPGYDNRKVRGGENIDPDKAAFSMAPHDDEAYERVNMDDQEPSSNPYGSYNSNHNQGGYNDTSYNGNGSNRYGDANPYSTDDDDPARYGSMPHRTNTLFESDSEYRPGGGAPPSMPYVNPPAGNAYDDNAVHFPSGNYDRTH